jgi:uncharacterized OB-fold protein
MPSTHPERTVKPMKIYSYSIVHTSSINFQDRTPYVCAILEDENNNRESFILEGYVKGTSVEIGMEVKEIPGPNGSIAYSL